MKSVTDIIPEELIYPTRMGSVIEYLRQAPLTAEEKVHLLTVWAHNVGVKVSASQRAAVRASGIDVR